MYNSDIIKNRNILYLDTFNFGASHEMFNAALLSMCSQVGNDVICKCSESNYNSISKVISINDFENIKYKKVFVFPGQSKISILLRYYISVFYTILYLVTSPKGYFVVIPYNNVFALKSINRLNSIFNRRIIIFCHNEMEALVSDVNVKGILSKFLYSRCINFFLANNVHLNKNLYFSVLGDKILHNLKSIIDDIKIKNFVSIDHPYIFNNQFDCLKTLPNKIIKIGTIGTLCQPKGGDFLLELAEKIPMEIKTKIKIYHIGRILYPIETINAAGINTLTNGGFLSREDYDRNISELDYILFFYDNRNYKVTASGAIMDAISHGIPIISLGNDYFEYIFEKFGSFGFLKTSVDEIVKLLSCIIEDNIVASFQVNTIRKNLSPEAIAFQFSKSLDLFEILS